MALEDPAVEEVTKCPAWKDGENPEIAGVREYIPHKAPITPANRIDDAPIVSNKYGGLCKKVSMVVVIPGESAGAKTM
ncbi:MAG: hypothetical protein LBE67_17255 [Kocuria palustris]|nr:hypothetical protein [Kocuria palustris]